MIVRDQEGFHVLRQVRPEGAGSRRPDCLSKAVNQLGYLRGTVRQVKPRAHLRGQHENKEDKL